jgi:hypothetical protein
MTLEVPTPTYCTPEEVADTIGLPDANDPNGDLVFSDTSYPNYNQVCRMIASNEDLIDRTVRRTWRENHVKDQVLTIPGYWHDINTAVRSEYYSSGGNFVQLRKDVREWDPSKGDKLEIRTVRNQWRDISDTSFDQTNESADNLVTLNRDVMGFWFDRPYGRLFLRLWLYKQYRNSLRISYRYGSEEPVPYSIARMCCLMTAIQVLNMQAYNIKVGTGGDIAGIKDQMIKNWTDEINTIKSSWQRVGSVHSLYE